MKNKISFILLIVLILFLVVPLINCDSSEENNPNKAPSCTISSPLNNVTIELGELVKILVSASDAEGTIESVTISIDNVTVATLNSSPYSFDWNTSNETEGTHTIIAKATDNGGLSTSAQVTVTLMANIPDVTTNDITEITGSTATGGGNVTDDGGSNVTARGVVWSTATNPTVASNDGSTSDGSGMGAFTSTISGLSINTTYFVRAYATNSAGTGYGSEKSFTTTGLPIVSTGDVTDITSNSAMGEGNITDDGGSAIIAKGLVWGPDGSNPTLESNEGFTNEGSGTGTFTSTMTSLARFTDYAYRAYATNDAGTTYGNSNSFMTQPALPVITTLDATGIAAHTATTGVLLTDDGGVDVVFAGVLWSSTPNPDINNFEGLINTNMMNGETYEDLMTGLNESSTYYMRAYATNDNGDHYAYGEEKTVTTSGFAVQQGDFTDTRDGKQYPTVEIYGQIWMAENLAYLPEVCASDANCGYWVYDYQGADVNTAKVAVNFPVYGVLYNWEMAKASCPAGWHLPTTNEWSELEINLGMSLNDATHNFPARGTNEGGKLKETGETHWTSGNTGASNEASFNAVPGGMRDVLDNSFKWLGVNCYFWTASTWGAPELNIWYRSLSNTSSRISLSSYSLNFYENLGMSVRCVKD